MTNITLQYLLRPFPQLETGVTQTSKQTMAAIEVVASSIFSSPPSSSSSSYLKFPLFPNSVRLENSTHYPNVSLKSLLWPLPLPSRNQWSHQLHCSTVEEVAVQEKEEKTEKIQRSNQRRKLFVLNLPWSLTVPDIKTLFAESGIVEDVEVTKKETNLCMFIWFLNKRC